MAKINLGSVVGPQGPQGPPGADGADGAQGIPGPNEISQDTSVVGITSGHFFYNENGNVKGKSITSNDIVEALKNAIQSDGYDNKKIVFNQDGSITETIIKDTIVLSTSNISFPKSNEILETKNINGVEKRRLIRFNQDGSIMEERYKC